MGKNLRVDNTDVFEWYDGIVLGIGYFGEIIALVCLLAFDPDAHKRTYVLAFISQKLADKFKTLFKVSGFSALNKKALSEAIINNPNLYLTQDKIADGKTISIVRLTPEQVDRLPSFCVPLVDRAVKPKRISDWIRQTAYEGTRSTP